MTFFGNCVLISFQAVGINHALLDKKCAHIFDRHLHYTTAVIGVNTTVIKLLPLHKHV